MLFFRIWWNGNVVEEFCDFGIVVVITDLHSHLDLSLLSVHYEHSHIFKSIDVLL